MVQVLFLKPLAPHLFQLRFQCRNVGQQWRNLSLDAAVGGHHLGLLRGVQAGSRQRSALAVSRMRIVELSAFQIGAREPAALRPRRSAISV